MRYSLGRLAVALLWSAGIFGAGSLPARAQWFPAKTIRIVVPFAPGGGNDVFARQLGTRLGEALKQPGADTKAASCAPSPSPAPAAAPGCHRCRP